MPALKITSSVYQDNTLGLTWFGDDAGPTIEVDILVRNDSGVLLSFSAVGYTACVSVELEQRGDWTAQVCRKDGKSSSAPVPLIVTAPLIVRVQNSGAALVLSWESLATYKTYVTTLEQRGVSSETHTVEGLSDTFEGVLTGSDWSCTVRACSDDGISMGPGTAYSPILVAPTVSRVDYSGSQLTVAWTPVSGYSCYSAWLQKGTEQAFPNVVSGQVMAVFEGALSDEPHHIWVCAQSPDGIVIGPPSRVFEPITASPTMNSVTYDGATLRMRWSAVPAGTVSLVIVQINGQQNRQLRTTGTTCTFPGPYAEEDHATCAVHAQSEDGVNTGPALEAYALITSSPELTRLDFDDNVLSIQWKNAESSVARANLLEVEGEGRTLSIPLGFTGQQCAEAALELGGTYGAVLLATNGIVRGPGSEAVVPITVSPLKPGLFCDGEHLSGRWENVSDQGIQSFDVELFQDGSLAEHGSCEEAERAFSSGLVANSVFGLRVRGCGAKSKGPWSVIAPGPYLVTLTYSYDMQSRIKSVDWSNGVSDKYSFDGAGNLLDFARTVRMED